MSDLKRGDDLFDKMKNNQDSAKDPSSKDESGQQADAGKSGGNAMSDDKSAAAQKGQTGADKKSASGEGEPANKDKDVVQDPDSWTKDSAFKEIKKLREENKAYREKYQQKLDEFRQQADSKLESQKQQMEELARAKKELDKIKEEQEDKKRDLSEKLAHREARIAEMEAKLNQTVSEYEQKMEQVSAKLSEYEAAKEAQNELNKQKVDDFMGKIPEKYKDIANLIVKGAGDYQDALVALNEAKLSGVFDEKQIVVNHDVPGANNGARATKDTLDNAAKEQRQKMSSSQKIGAALKEIRGGASNSAFKGR